MTKGGIIIRLIDVAMIILFGFIVISDIKVRAQIKLPSDEQPSEAREIERKLIFVEISSQEALRVKEGDNVTEVTDIEALEKRLVQLHHQYESEGIEMVVIIDPDQDSIIQMTVEVLDICERNQIAKNIKY